MFDIDARTGNISLTRGDTLHLPVMVTKDGAPEERLGPEDAATMTVRESGAEGAEVLLQKQAQEGTIHILPEDTSGLAFGTQKRYMYDIEIRFADGDVYTIGPSRFILLPEVTY